MFSTSDFHYWLGAPAHTRHSQQERVLVSVCACKETHALCAPEGPDYMPCWEMKSQWIDFLTQCTVFPCGHTCGCRDSKHTNNQRHTHTHKQALFSQLTGCPLVVFLKSSFLLLISSTLPAGHASVYVHLCVYVFQCVCVELKLML